MNNLSEAIHLSDTSIIYDNTSGTGMRRILEAQIGQITYVSPQ